MTGRSRRSSAGGVLADAPAAPGRGSSFVVAHVVAPAPFGGLEQVVIGLAAGQASRGHRVHLIAVVAPGEGDHPFVAQARAAGLDVVVLEIPGRAYLRERAEVRDLCRRLGVQVVHTHGYRPDVIAGSAARSLGVVTVATVHGFCGGSWRNRLYEWMQTVAYRRFGAVVAVSAKLGGELREAGVPAARLHVVRNGWTGGAAPLSRDAARAELGLTDLPPASCHLGWVGRISREKGLDVLVDTLPLLRDLPVTLSVVGDGAGRAALEARAAALGVAARIRWHGMIHGAGRVVSAYDAFVLSSRTEGTPIALLEAIAAEVPVVATAVGGVPDVVSPAEALLVPTEDPPALAAAIRTLVDDPAAASARAASARTRLGEELGPALWLDRYEAVYRQAQHLQRVRSE